jgi:hypothetical protein
MNENYIKNEVWKGVEFWSNQIKNAGVYDKLAFFNDVFVEKKPPHTESGYNLVLSNILLDGKHCDIYHTDQDSNGNKIKDRTFHRVFIHIKE